MLRLFIFLLCATTAGTDDGGSSPGATPTSTLLAFGNSPSLGKNSADFVVGINQADVELTHVAARERLFAVGTKVDDGALLSEERGVLLLLLLHCIDW